MKEHFHAKCIMCGKEYEAKPDITTCTSCKGILDIVYDYKAIAASVDKKTMSERKDPTQWRFREFLPISPKSDTTGLRVGGSPLYKAKRLGELLGMPNLYIKDDGLNPTSSLKDRASAMAVVKASEAGADTIACSSTGNAASSLAGNAAARGFKTFIFVPQRAPAGKVSQLLIFGANVISVQGNYEDTFRLSAEAIDRWGWYNRNAAINPFLSEGKKTVTLEIAEQMDWNVPDYLVMSVGDGCTIAGAWKGFKDLYAAGFISKLPRLISVQAEGCCPINTAVDKGVRELVPSEENTIADSIAVGTPRNFHKAYDAIVESKGITINVSDEEILSAMSLLGKTSGVFGEPAGVAGTAGLIKAVKANKLPKDATVVSVVTGNGLKDIVSAQKAVGKPISVPADMQQLLSAFKAQGGPQ